MCCNLNPAIQTTSKSIKWSLRRFLRIKVVNPSPGALAIQVLVTHFCCFGSTFQPQVQKKVSGLSSQDRNKMEQQIAKN